MQPIVRRLLPTSAALAGVFVVTSAAFAVSDVTVVSAVGMRQVMLDLAPKFETATGHRVMMTFESSGLIGKRLQDSPRADVVLINEAGLKQLVQAGRIDGPATPIATSRIGVAVRSGTPMPDISTPVALRRSLLAARMVAYPDPGLGGSSGVHLAAMMERLGIAAQMTSRTMYAEPPGPNATTPGSIVAAGKADIALHQMQELIAVPGIEIAGPLPDELQETFTFVAAIVRGAADVAAAKALTQFLTTAQSRTVILAKGMGAPAR